MPLPISTRSLALATALLFAGGVALAGSRPSPRPSGEAPVATLRLPEHGDRAERAANGDGHLLIERLRDQLAELDRQLEADGKDHRSASAEGPAGDSREAEPVDDVLEAFRSALTRGAAALAESGAALWTQGRQAVDQALDSLLDHLDRAAPRPSRRPDAPARAA